MGKKKSEPDITDIFKQLEEIGWYEPFHAEDEDPEQKQLCDCGFQVTDLVNAYKNVLFNILRKGNYKKYMWEVNDAIPRVEDSCNITLSKLKRDIKQLLRHKGSIEEIITIIEKNVESLLDKFATCM